MVDTLDRSGVYSRLTRITEDAGPAFFSSQHFSNAYAILEQFKKQPKSFSLQVLKWQVFGSRHHTARLGANPMKTVLSVFDFLMDNIVGVIIVAAALAGPPIIGMTVFDVMDTASDTIQAVISGQCPPPETAAKP